MILSEKEAGSDRSVELFEFRNKSFEICFEKDDNPDYFAALKYNMHKHMENKKALKIKKKTLLLFILLSLAPVSFSQKNDSTIVPRYFGGAVTLTNNGISFIPTFNLGKPAAIFTFNNEYVKR